MLAPQGREGRQIIPFRRALSKSLSRRSVRYEYVSIDVIRKNNWSPEDLIDCLLDSDAHFILYHLHQGLEDMGWNMTELANELVKLYYHPGFPFGSQLSCPIFLQVSNLFVLSHQLMMLKDKESI